MNDIDLDAIRQRADDTDTGLREALTLARRGGYEPAARAARDAILTLPALLSEVDRLRLLELRLRLIESERDELRDKAEQVESYGDMWRSAAVEAQGERDALAAKVTSLAEHLDDMADSLDGHATHEDIHRLLIEGLAIARGNGGGSL